MLAWCGTYCSYQLIFRGAGGVFSKQSNVVQCLTIFVLNQVEQNLAYETVTFTKHSNMYQNATLVTRGNTYIQPELLENKHPSKSPSPTPPPPFILTGYCQTTS